MLRYKTFGPLRFNIPHVVCVSVGALFPYPPVIESGPMTTFLRLYQRLVLMCTASGNPQPTITWYKDGRMILGEISPLLVIGEVELSDRGVYHCTATSTQGTATSTEAYVNVISKLPMVHYILEHK